MLNRKLLNKTLTSQQVAEIPDGENCFDAGKQWINININENFIFFKIEHFDRIICNSVRVAMQRG